MVASNKDWTMRNPPSLEPLGRLALLSVLIAVPAFLMIGVLEPGLVLPAFSILVFAETAIAARSEGVTLWDIAGAFTMMGCAAAIFSEPDQVAQLFEQTGRTTSGQAAVGDSHQAGPLWQPAGCDVGLELN